MSSHVLHTAADFDGSGLRRLKSDIDNYFADREPVPLMRGPSIHNSQLIFTYTDTLLALFLQDPDKMKKPHEVAVKYGFRGYSKGGKNGVFYQRRGDERLGAATADFIKQYKSIILPSLKINDLNDAKPIKVVYHSGTGERIVGVMSEHEKIKYALLLDFASY